MPKINANLLCRDLRCHNYIPPFYFVSGKLSVEIKYELQVGRNFKIIERESDIHVIESKTKMYRGKKFKFDTS